MTTGVVFTFFWLALIAGLLAATAWMERHVVDLPERDDDLFSRPGRDEPGVGWVAAPRSEPAALTSSRSASRQGRPETAPGPPPAGPGATHRNDNTPGAQCRGWS